MGVLAMKEGMGMLELTCMFNVIPSPLLPLTVAVTTTNWSFATKFLIHLSLLADSWPGWAWMSNLRALTRGRRNARSSLNVIEGSMLFSLTVEEEKKECRLLYFSLLNTTCASFPATCESVDLRLNSLLRNLGGRGLFDRRKT
jgi:hypothetical protein